MIAKSIEPIDPLTILDPVAGSASTTSLTDKKRLDRLLVVEDNPGDARLLQVLFDEQGSPRTPVTHVDCLKDAEAFLADNPVDIILLDLGLPDAQGLEAVRRVHSAAPDVPLVVLTGLDDEVIATQALQEGAQDYLVKGQIETRGLLRALRYSVERKVLEEALIAERALVHAALEADISARKVTEESLKESEEHYRLLFDSNPQPMYVFDMKTLDFIAVNDAAVIQYGYSREEFLAMSLKALRRPDEIPALLAVLDKATHADPREGSTSFGVFTHRRKNGTLVQVDISANRIRLRGHEAWLALALDVTGKRDLEAQLLQAQKMDSVGRLAGGVAHDFNNILGVITGYGELLGRRVSGDARLRKYAEDIVKAAERGAGLTRQLLAFSRKQVLQPRVLDLNVVVGDMERMLRRVIGEDVQLVTVFDDQLGAVKADPGQMEQVLMNLAVNARDAMEHGGRLTIETGNAVLDDAYSRLRPGVPAGRYVMMSVSDTGQGMGKEVLARAFEPFYTTKDPGKGTGLGLATVHGIVKQSDGHIWAYSEPGRGTNFKIYLPRVDAAAEADAIVSIPVAAPRGSETVLLVEDEESLREIIRECLEDSGYTVIDADSGEAAVTRCTSYEGAIDLLITDVVMPGIGGREVAERLQTLRPRLRALYMSGYTDDAVVLHGVLAEDMAFLQKPFSALALAMKVRQVLDAPR